MMKKLVALILAVVMIMAMGSVAFAAVDKDLGSFEGKQAPSEGFGLNSGKVALTKSIMIFNTEDGTSVRVPNVSFTYAVEPANSSECGTVTDGDKTVQVLPGVSGGVGGTTISFGPTDPAVSAKTTGTKVEKTGELTVDPTAAGFTRAGIYRYKITETATNLAESGLEARTSDYDTERFLDLYMKNNAAGTGLELYAAIIFKTISVDDSTGGGTAATTAVTTTTDKTTGYEPGDPGTDPSGSGNPDYTNDEEVDRYFTYNVEVTKEITGNLADKTHPFPFQITINNGTVTNTVTVDVDNNGTVGTKTISSSASITDSFYLANEQSYIVKGLPKGFTATVTEYNDITVDDYKLTTTLTGTTTTATKADAAVSKDSTSPTGESNVLINSNDSSSVVARENTVLKFTNNLPEISVTGVVTRVAPYVLILAAGMVLVLISRRRKAEEE